MFQRPNITEKNEILCTLHSQKIEYFYQGNACSNSQLRCSACLQNSMLSGNTKSQLQSDPSHETLTVTLLDVPRPSIDENLKVKPPIDFENAQLEHIIKDYRAKGYPPRNLVYIPDDEILVACGYNGRVILWQVGDTVDFLSAFDIEGTLRCAKYIMTESDKLLVFGVDKALHIYKLDGKSAVFVTKLECHCDVNDVEYLPDKQKLIVVGWSPYIRFWNIGSSFTFDRTVDATSYGAEQPLCTAIYIKDKNSIAIEDKDGICMVDLSAENDTDRLPKRYSSFGRKGYGLVYLGKQDQFMLRTVKNRACIVDAKTLSLIGEYNGVLNCSDLPGYRFMPNEDESLILSNSNSTDLMIYKGFKYSLMNLTNLLTQSAGVEVLHDQYRFAVADQFSGTILIFRTNIFGNYKYRPHFIGNRTFMPAKPPIDKSVSPSPVKPSIFAMTASPSKNLFSSSPSITGFKPSPIPFQPQQSDSNGTPAKFSNSQSSSPSKRPQRQAALTAQAKQNMTTRNIRNTGNSSNARNVKAVKKGNPIFAKNTRSATISRAHARRLAKTARITTARQPRQVKKPGRPAKKSQVRDIKARMQQAIRKTRNSQVQRKDENEEAPTQFIRKKRVTEGTDPKLKLTFELGGKVLAKEDLGAIGEEDFPGMEVEEKVEKKGRGRPRKSGSPDKSVEEVEEKVEKRGRGRPRKSGSPDKSVEEVEEKVEKRGRGRPRKSGSSPNKSVERSPKTTAGRRNPKVVSFLKNIARERRVIDRVNRAITRSRSRDKGVAVRKTGTRSTFAKRG